jgi:hypothetical protein
MFEKRIPLRVLPAVLLLAGLWAQAADTGDPGAAAATSQSGVIVGTVAGKGDAAKGEQWIKVKPDAGGPAETIAPRWTKNPSAPGGKFDPAMLRVFTALTVGERVEIAWVAGDVKHAESIKHGDAVTKPALPTTQQINVAGVVTERTAEYVMVKVGPTESAHHYYINAEMDAASVAAVAKAKVGDKVVLMAVMADGIKQIRSFKLAGEAAGAKPVETPKETPKAPLATAPTAAPKPVPASAPAKSETGVFIGTVANKGSDFVWVQSGEDMEKFTPRWMGGAVSEGGGPEAAALKAIAALKVGQKVTVRWILQDRKRIVEIQVD